MQACSTVRIASRDFAGDEGRHTDRGGRVGGVESITEKSESWDQVAKIVAVTVLQLYGILSAFVPVMATQ